MKNEIVQKSKFKSNRFGGRFNNRTHLLPMNVHLVYIEDR